MPTKSSTAKSSTAKSSTIKARAKTGSMTAAKALVRGCLRTLKAAPRATKTAGTTKAQLLETIRNLEYQLEHATQPKPAPVPPARHGYLWTGGEERYLSNYFKNGGIDLFEAAKALQRTPYTVFLRAFKLNLTNEDNVYLLWKIAAEHIPGVSDAQRDAWAEQKKAADAEQKAYNYAREQEWQEREISRSVTPGNHFYR